MLHPHIKTILHKQFNSCKSIFFSEKGTEVIAPNSDPYICAIRCSEPLIIQIMIEI